MKSIGKLAVLLTLVFGLGSHEASAARKLTSREAIEVIRATENILKAGEKEAAEELRAAFVADQILAEDNWPGNLYGQTPIRIAGTRKITVNKNILPDPSERRYQLRFGKIDLFEDRTFLEGILVHEWVHTRQAYLQAIFRRSTIEPEAYQRQKVYLQKVMIGLDSADPDLKFKKVRIESLIDRIDAELEGNNFTGCGAEVVGLGSN